LVNLLNRFEYIHSCKHHGQYIDEERDFFNCFRKALEPKYAKVMSKETAFPRLQPV